MRQRGRKAAAASLVQLNLTGEPPRLPAPEGLTTEEKTLFTQIVTSCAPTHFVKSDAMLLTSLVQATLLARRSAVAMLSGDADQIGIFEKATKLQAMLATRLRLAPQSRMNSRDAGRKSEQATGQMPWE